MLAVATIWLCVARHHIPGREQGSDTDPHAEAKLCAFPWLPAPWVKASRG